MKLLKNKLIDRFTIGEVPRPNIWFRYGKWSVLNCGELMATHPCAKEMIKGGVYGGWEAMKGEIIIRRDDLQDLLKATSKKEL